MAIDVADLRRRYDACQAVTKDLSGLLAPDRVADSKALWAAMPGLLTELERLRERVQATAEVGCVNSPAGRRWPMKCLPRDPCSFCRARVLLESL